MKVQNNVNLHVWICQGRNPQVTVPHTSPTAALVPPMGPPNYVFTEPQMEYQVPESPNLTDTRFLEIGRNLVS